MTILPLTLPSDRFAPETAMDRLASHYAIQGSKIMPTEAQRSELYASLIAGPREVPECIRCGREHWSCECFTNHHGSGAPSLTSGPVSVTQEETNGHRR